MKFITKLNFSFNASPLEKVSSIARQLQLYRPLLGIWNIFVIVLILIFYWPLMCLSTFSSFHTTFCTLVYFNKNIEYERSVMFFLAGFSVRIISSARRRFYESLYCRFQIPVLRSKYTNHFFICQFSSYAKLLKGYKKLSFGIFSIFFLKTLMC